MSTLSETPRTLLNNKQKVVIIYVVLISISMLAIVLAAFGVFDTETTETDPNPKTFSPKHPPDNVSFWD